MDVVSTTVGWSLLIILPTLHIGLFYYFWNNNERFKVDKEECKCECFDGVFKGSYELGPSSYKHIYFNATINTFIILVITATYAIIFYEIVRYIVSLARKQNLRFEFLILAVSAILPHYYGWWALFNFFNDGFFSQLPHQLIFSASEAITLTCVLLLCNASRPISLSENGSPASNSSLSIRFFGRQLYSFSALRALFYILGISSAHILLGSLDQFLENLVLGAGRRHQMTRDALVLLAPDLLHAAVALRHTRKLIAERGGCWRSLATLAISRDLLEPVAFSLLFLCAGLLLF